MKALVNKILLIATMTSILAASFLQSRSIAASESVSLDRADYTFYPNLPDPASWNVWAQGNVSQVAADGYGLALADPDNWSGLLYTHPAPFLTADPNDPNFENTATFRAQSQVPYIFDGSLAWSGNAIGWRMIVDDGLHRLELALSRSATFAREVRLENTPSFIPMPFPWDNELDNTYEIARLSDGNYLVTLTNADPAVPPVSKMVLAGSLPPSSGTPEFAWGMAALGGGVAYWQEVHVEMNSPASQNLLDSADYSFYFNLPDPAVWRVSAEGNVVQLPVDGLGLGMSDLDQSGALLYLHDTPFLSGDPGNPNFYNTATFHARAQIPHISDGSGAWSSGTIGWRMVLDDGYHRLELTLARSQSSIRQVQVKDSTSIPALDFPWDNGLPNTYEITKLADGNFVLTLTNADTSNPNPVITQHISAGLLPPSSGTPLFAWGAGREGGGVFYWQDISAEVYSENPNQPPVVVPINAPTDPVLVNTAISANAPFSDPDSADTHTTVWEWGDGSSSSGIISYANSEGMVSGSHVYNMAGVYPITLIVQDDRGASTAATFQYVVVYDPSAGFVTGGGWIDSPAGAYKLDPSLNGKATFGFVSRYKKGATAPTGDTEFQFKVANLNFHSTSYEWLVVNRAGTNAQFKGNGAINGASGYKFMLSAGDSTTDTFHIRIWEETNGVETVIYDNEIDQPIGGGSIIVHKA